MHIGLICGSVGNLGSLRASLKLFGFESDIVDDLHKHSNYDGFLMPGVGSFGQVAQELDRKFGLEVLRNFVLTIDRPFVGICVGMQILLEAGEEGGWTPGLGLFKGSVERFCSEDVMVPHMGWNTVYERPEIDGSRDVGDYYFVHSFRARVTGTESSKVVGWCHHGEWFPAILNSGNIWGVQFHPEKSQLQGKSFLKKIYVC